MLDQGAKRVNVKGIELVGGEHAGQQREPEKERRILEMPLFGRAWHPGRLQAGEPRRAAKRVPEAPQRVLSRGRAAAQPVGQHRSVHRSGACPADAYDFKARLLEQTVENTPGESAMRATALQCQRDLVAS